MFALSVFSQTQTKPIKGDASKFALGIKADFISSQVKINGNFKSTFDPGFTAGIFARFGRRFYFQPELMYALQTRKLSGIIDNVEENIENKSHAINVPLLLGGTLINNKNFKLRIFAGPDFSFTMGNSYKDAKDFFSRLDYGGLVGFGVDLWRFTVDAGYQFTFAENKAEDPILSHVQYNLFKVGVGFKLFR